MLEAKMLEVEDLVEEYEREAVVMMKRLGADVGPYYIHEVAATRR
jgi:hypothetical protein